MKKHSKSQASVVNCQLSRRGFTLIELLVVVSIISILASLLIANFVGIRQRGRDAQRKSDLRQVQTALELYRADNGTYPVSLSACGSPFTYNSTTYMQKLPCDPLQETDYTFSSDGIIYTIYACLENDNDSDRDNTTQPGCTAVTNNSFTVANP